MKWRRLKVLPACLVVSVLLAAMLACVAPAQTLPGTNVEVPPLPVDIPTPDAVEDVTEVVGDVVDAVGAVVPAADVPVSPEAVVEAATQTVEQLAAPATRTAGQVAGNASLPALPTGGVSQLEALVGGLPVGTVTGLLPQSPPPSLGLLPAHPRNLIPIPRVIRDLPILKPIFDLLDLLLGILFPPVVTPAAPSSPNPVADPSSSSVTPVPASPAVVAGLDPTSGGPYDHLPSAGGRPGPGGKPLDIVLAAIGGLLGAVLVLSALEHRLVRRSR
ncbi:MAG: hypothetical protein KKF41_10450 [Actinobacteria bacterium]|nr:hypothetical protein [Actinomycetota bacterium]MBU1943059.1 hypothetical protein [Actinomycetota bacterium]MBU2687994.1 hypothetical protein [Actinomycetota bacterium]